MGIGADKVREIQKVSQEPVSLHTPIGEEEDSQLGDFIEDSDAVVPVDAASFILLQEQLEGVLETLSEREKKVVQLRFGLVDGHPRTLEEVGREFGVTRERIRQIEVEDPLEAAAPQPFPEAPRLPGVRRRPYAARLDSTLDPTRADARCRTREHAGHAAQPS